MRFGLRSLFVLTLVAATSLWLAEAWSIRTAWLVALTMGLFVGLRVWGASDPAAPSQDRARPD